MSVEQIKTAFWHPITGIALLFSAVGQLGFGVLEPIWTLVSSTANLWFPVLATSGATILPELGYPDLGTHLLIGGAVVYVGVKVDRLILKVQQWYENR